MNTETMKLLQEVPAGEGRWWKVELIRNVATKPIRVTLMEQNSVMSRFVSTPLHHKRTIATPLAVSETAKLILQEVGGFEQVIGEFPAFEQPTLSEGWVFISGVAHHFKEGEAVSDCGSAFYRAGDRREGGNPGPADCAECASYMDAAHA